jgi:hypothetical protein
MMDIPALKGIKGQAAPGIRFRHGRRRGRRLRNGLRGFAGEEKAQGPKEKSIKGKKGSVRHTFLNIVILPKKYLPRRDNLRVNHADRTR